MQLNTSTQQEPGVSLETTSFILRFGPGHSYGKPWESSITGVVFDGCAYLSALKGWQHGYTVPILKALASIGCTRVCYLRVRKNGAKHLVDMNNPERYRNT